MRLAELLQDIGTTHPHAVSVDAEVSGLAYDSRRVEPGYLFAAWAGAAADGHTFVPEALRRGAAVILCERAVETGGIPCIQVPQVRQVLAQAARRFYHDPTAALKMVAVTGTSGKTTTVHLIEAVLAAAGMSPGVIGTLGSRYAGHAVEGNLTTPESIDLMALLEAMRAGGCKSVAMEASSQALDQDRVFGARFDVAVYTNLSQDHLDYHHDFAQYFAAKARLFTAHLKPTGRAVVNLDDARGIALMGPHALGYSASGSKAAAVRADTIGLSETGLQLAVSTPRGQMHLSSPLLGRFNVDNILAAVGVGFALGVDDASIVRGIAAMASVPGRLERVNRPGEPLVLVDYSHKPDALVKALATVREVTQGRLICIVGCGGDRDATKRQPMGEAAGRGADWAILTNDNPRTEDPARIAAAVELGLQAAGARRASATEAAIAPAIVPGNRTYCVELDRGRAIGLAVRAARPGDTVLIAGKGHETYQIIGREKFPFDDRQQARAALDALVPAASRRQPETP